jgi:predicted transcriptional regulator
MSEPRPGSIGAKLLSFLRDNPEDYLTYDDCEVKFGCRRSALSMAVCRLVDAGLIEKVPERPPGPTIRLTGWGRK